MPQYLDVRISVTPNGPAPLSDDAFNEGFHLLTYQGMAIYNPFEAWGYSGDAGAWGLYSGTTAYLPGPFSSFPYNERVVWFYTMEGSVVGTISDADLQAAGHVLSPVSLGPNGDFLTGNGRQVLDPTALPTTNWVPVFYGVGGRSNSYGYYVAADQAQTLGPIGGFPLSAYDPAAIAFWGAGITSSTFAEGLPTYYTDIYIRVDNVVGIRTDESNSTIVQSEDPNALQAVTFIVYLDQPLLHGSATVTLNAATFDVTGIPENTELGTDWFTTQDRGIAPLVVTFVAGGPTEIPVTVWVPGSQYPDALLQNFGLVIDDHLIAIGGTVVTVDPDHNEAYGTIRDDTPNLVHVTFQGDAAQSHANSSAALDAGSTSAGSVSPVAAEALYRSLVEQHVQAAFARLAQQYQQLSGGTPFSYHPSVMIAFGDLGSDVARARIETLIPLEDGTSIPIALARYRGEALTDAQARLPDMTITINSNALGSRIYSGASDRLNGGPNYDMVTILMHEIMHGLGFSLQGGESSGTPFWNHVGVLGGGYSFNYDIFGITHSVPLDGPHVATSFGHDLMNPGSGYAGPNQTLSGFDFEVLQLLGYVSGLEYSHSMASGSSPRVSLPPGALVLTAGGNNGISGFSVTSVDPVAANHLFTVIVGTALGTLRTHRVLDPGDDYGFGSVATASSFISGQSLTLSGTLEEINAALAELSVSYDRNASGADQIDILVVDSRGASTEQTVAVTVNPWDGRPAVPTISGPVSGSTIGNPNPTITGTGEVGDLVSIMFDGVLVGVVAVASNGTWSFRQGNTSLPDGVHTITATQATVAGVTSIVSATDTITIDRSLPPPVPTITGPASGGRVATVNPTITGTGEIGDTITVFVDGVASGTATVRLNGTWSLMLRDPLSNAMHTVTATATAINTSPASDAGTFIVDTSNLPGGRVVQETDVLNQYAWSSYAAHYDAQGQVVTTVIINDDGTHALVGYDAARVYIWSTYRNDYDGLGRLATFTTSNDDGSRVILGYDAAGENSWSNYRLEVDPQGHNRTNTISYDDGSHASIAYDWTGGFGWSAFRTDYDLQGNLAAYTYSYNNGARSIYGFDSSNQYSWSSDIINIDAQGRLTDSTASYDDGRYEAVQYTYDSQSELSAVTINYGSGERAVVTYDPAGQYDWSNYRDNYDTQGRLVSSNVAYDDGTHAVLAYDPQAQFNWSDYRTDYDTQGRVASSTVVYDDGARAVIGYDPQNQFNWSDFRTDYNNLGQVADTIVVYDNGTRADVIYDAGNQFNWSYYRNDYDAQGHFVGQAGVYDDGTLWHV